MLPADTASLDWTLNPDGSASVATKAGYEFADGTTTKTFPAPTDVYDPAVPATTYTPSGSAVTVTVVAGGPDSVAVPGGDHHGTFALGDWLPSRDGRTATRVVTYTLTDPAVTLVTGDGWTVSADGKTATRTVTDSCYGTDSTPTTSTSATSDAAGSASQAHGQDGPRGVPAKTGAEDDLPVVPLALVAAALAGAVATVKLRRR